MKQEIQPIGREDSIYYQRKSAGRKRMYLLGCPVDNLSFPETLARIDEIIKNRVPAQHVVINVDKILKVRRDPQFARIVASCALINADGMAVVWASRLVGVPLKERVAGIDLMEKLVEHSVQKSYKLYFLGAKEEIVVKIVSGYREKYPDLSIVGYRNGYWDVSEEETVVNDIRRSQADILFVAISSPKKEMFLNRYLQQLGIPFVMGVGGSFDVVAGYKRRAPQWMQNVGLEWLFRFCQEPCRLAKRYLLGNTQFIFLLAKDIVKSRILGKNR